MHHEMYLSYQLIYVEASPLSSERVPKNDGECVLRQVHGSTSYSILPDEVQGLSVMLLEGQRGDSLRDGGDFVAASAAVDGLVVDRSFLQPSLESFFSCPSATDLTFGYRTPPVTAPLFAVAGSWAMEAGGRWTSFPMRRVLSARVEEKDDCGNGVYHSLLSWGHIRLSLMKVREVVVHGYLKNVHHVS